MLRQKPRLPPRQSLGKLLDVTIMPDKNELPADPKAVEKWQNLPQGAPSREALPPATGGTRWANRFMIGLAILLVVLLLLSKSGVLG